VPYYSYWAVGDDVTTNDEQLNEGHKENNANDDPPTKCGTCISIDEEELKKYECAVCFEVMDTPVGCGSCQVRFCRPCLERIAKQGGASPRCSHCRAPFTFDSIQVDEALLEAINNSTDTVHCSVSGCGKKVAMKALKVHEEQCDHIKFKCKFSEWGCTWIGKKKDLEHHDNNECEFRNELGRLVHAIRQKALNQTEEIARLQNTRLNQIVNIHTRRMSMIRGRNAGNVFDVLAMSYEAVCFPGRFAATIDMWGEMVIQDHPRSMALNVLLTLPLIILISKCTFWMFFDLSNMTPETIYEAGLIEVFKHFSQCILPTSTALIAIISMIVDDADAFEWSETPVPETEGGVPGGIPYVRDIVAFCLFVSCYCFVDYWQNPGIILLLATFKFIVYFASCVARILEKVRGLEEGALKKSRNWATIVFALRYSCLFQSCTPLHAVKGIIILRLVNYVCLQRGMLKLNLTVEETECFLAAVPPIFLASLGGALTAFDYMEIINEDEDWSMALYGWYSSAAVLVILNIFTHVVYYGGKVGGEVIYDEGESMRNLNIERIASYNLVPSQRPSVLGIFILSLTVFYMIFIMCI